MYSKWIFSSSLNIYIIQTKAPHVDLLDGSDLSVDPIPHNVIVKGYAQVDL